MKIISLLDLKARPAGSVDSAVVRSGLVEIERLRQVEADLSESLARERLLVEQKDELIRHKDLLSAESDHRLMNGLQMVTSLLSMQSRLTHDKEAAAQVKVPPIVSPRSEACTAACTLWTIWKASTWANISRPCARISPGCCRTGATTMPSRSKPFR